MSDLLNEIVNKYMFEKVENTREILRKCMKIAGEFRHARDQEALGPEDKSPSRIDRRVLCQFILASAGTGALAYGVSKLGDNIGIYSKEKIYEFIDAQVGKRFEITSSFVADLGQARRSGFRFAPPSNLTRDEARLWRIASIFDRGEMLHIDDRVMLGEIRLGRNEPDVRALASVLHSAELGRCGLGEQSMSAAATPLPLDKLSSLQKFSLIVQRTNVGNIRLRPAQLFDPASWETAAPLMDLDAHSVSLFGDTLLNIISLDDSELSALLKEYGPPLIHAVFFALYRVTADPELSQLDRARLWTEFLDFDRRCLHPRIAAHTDVLRAVWNHLLLIILQAHRSSDFELRNRVIRIATGSDDFLFKGSTIDHHLAARFHSMDHNYALFVLALQTISATDTTIDLSGRLQTDLRYFVKHRERLRNQQLRVALDTIRKATNESFSANDATREYLVTSEMFGSYILDINVPAMQAVVTSPR